MHSKRRKHASAGSGTDAREIDGSATPEAASRSSGRRWASSAAPAPSAAPRWAGSCSGRHPRRIWIQGQKAGAPSPSQQRPHAPRLCPSGEFLGQPRLADTRLARHDHDAALAPTGRVEALQQRGQLALASNKGRAPSPCRHPSLFAVRPFPGLVLAGSYAPRLLPGYQMNSPADAGGPEGNAAGLKRRREAVDGPSPTDIAPRG
jgi:hypothetical protein